jgi:hypothetical protein
LFKKKKKEKKEKKQKEKKRKITPAEGFDPMVYKMFPVRACATSQKTFLFFLFFFFFFFPFFTMETKTEK